MLWKALLGYFLLGAVLYGFGAIWYYWARDTLDQIGSLPFEDGEKCSSTILIFLKMLEYVSLFTMIHAVISIPIYYFSYMSFRAGGTAFLNAARTMLTLFLLSVVCWFFLEIYSSFIAKRTLAECPANLDIINYYFWIVLVGLSIFTIVVGFCVAGMTAHRGRPLRVFGITLITPRNQVFEEDEEMN